MHSVTRLALTSVLTALAVVTVSGTARADEPTTWVSGEPLSGLEFLFLLVGAPAALFVVIAVIAFALSRKNYVPPPSTEVEPVDSHH